MRFGKERIRNMRRMVCGDRAYSRRIGCWSLAVEKVGVRKKERSVHLEGHLEGCETGWKKDLHCKSHHGQQQNNTPFVRYGPLKWIIDIAIGIKVEQTSRVAGRGVAVRICTTGVRTAVSLPHGG